MFPQKNFISLFFKANLLFFLFGKAKILTLCPSSTSLLVRIRPIPPQPPVTNILTLPIFINNSRSLPIPPDESAAIATFPSQFPQSP